MKSLNKQMKKFYDMRPTSFLNEIEASPRSGTELGIAFLIISGVAFAFILYKLYH